MARLDEKVIKCPVSKNESFRCKFQLPNRIGDFFIQKLSNKKLIGTQIKTSEDGNLRLDMVFVEKGGTHHSDSHGIRINNIQKRIKCLNRKLKDLECPCCGDKCDKIKSKCNKKKKNKV